jgi:hypothetical protein
MVSAAPIKCHGSHRHITLGERSLIEGGATTAAHLTAKSLPIWEIARLSVRVKLSRVSARSRAAYRRI